MGLISFTSLQVISELAGKNVDEVIASGECTSLQHLMYESMLVCKERQQDLLLSLDSSCNWMPCYQFASGSVLTCVSCLPTSVSSGFSKLASMPAGGAVAVATSAAGGSGGAAAPAAGEYSTLAPSAHLGHKACVCVCEIP